MAGLVIFLIPGKKEINGGIMSIFSLCKESRKFQDIHKSDVVISVPPGEQTYKHNDFFENEEEIYDFEKIVKLYPNPENIIIHIPEFMVNVFLDNLKVHSDYLKNIKHVHFNILNQNDELMPTTLSVLRLYELCNELTITTAHLRYTSQKASDKFGVPVHLLSVSLDPGDFVRVKYESKENIIVVSPDQQNDKTKILKNLQVKLPSYEIIEIRNLHYKDYKALISKAKFAITFGEGFDGYLIESTFSGSVSFAVYNETFFPSNEYLKLHNIYGNYDEMFANIATDISFMDSSSIYTNTNKKLYELLQDIYSYKLYIENIKNFYHKKYLYTPKNANAMRIFAKEFSKRDFEIQNNAIKINSLEQKIISQADEVEALKNSVSWRVTKPLRRARKTAKRHSK